MNNIMKFRKIMKYTMSLVLAVIALNMAGCSGGSSSENSNPSGFSGEQRSKYDNLSSEGKSYVDKQMEAYDKAKK